MEQITTPKVNGRLDERTKFRPRYLDKKSPDKYRFICGHCSERYGEPDLQYGHIDITRCDGCPPLRVN